MVGEIKELTENVTRLVRVANAEHEDGLGPKISCCMEEPCELAEALKPFKHLLPSTNLPCKACLGSGEHPDMVHTSTKDDLGPCPECDGLGYIEEGGG